MTTATTNTIPALKTAFLTSQIRILSQPLQPEKAQRRKKSTHANAIPENVLKDVTRDVNRRIRRHAKEVYSALAVRAVAEQIDNLYWARAGDGLEAAEDERDGLEGQDQGSVRMGEDLALEGNISRVRATLEDITADETTLHSTAEDLEAQFVRLEALARKRAAMRKKLASYNTLLDALKPFKQPLESVQPNLVTKDGALASELTRMRTAGLRVNSRLGEWVEGRDGIEDGKEEWMGEEEKLKRLLRM